MNNEIKENQINNLIKKEKDCGEHCPKCHQKLEEYFINFKETVKLCPSRNCSYPFLPNDKLEIRNVEEKRKDVKDNGDKEVLSALKSDENLLDQLDLDLDAIIEPLIGDEQYSNEDFDGILKELMASCESNYN